MLRSLRSTWARVEQIVVPSTQIDGTQNGTEDLDYGITAAIRAIFSLARPMQQQRLAGKKGSRVSAQTGPQFGK